MTLAPFDPATHGFHFPNCFVNRFALGPLKFASGGRCGGMSYVSLDYYFENQPIPDLCDLPAGDTILGKYIIRRQVHSLLNQLPGFANGMSNPFGLRSRGLFSRCLPGGRMLDKLRRALDTGRPVPLGLVAPTVGLTDTHHQVVAVGYTLTGRDPRSLRVKIYDPNHPNEPVTMIPELERNQFRTELPDGSPSRPWRTFFVDHRYRPQRVPATGLTLSPWLTVFLREEEMA